MNDNDNEYNEEVIEFARYLSTLKFHDMNDLVNFCMEYRDYQLTCPKDKFHLAYKKYLLVLSQYGTVMIDHILQLHEEIRNVAMEIEKVVNEKKSG